MKTTETQEMEMLNLTDTNKIRVATCIAKRINDGMDTEAAVAEAQQILGISRGAVIECLKFGVEYMGELAVQFRTILEPSVQHMNLSVAWSR